MIKKTVLATLFTATMIMGTTSAFAAEKPSDSHVDKMERQSRDCMHKKCDMDGFSFGPFKGIDLTQEQKDKIKSLNEERRKDKENSLDPRSNMKELMKMNGELRAASYSKDYSQDKIKDIFAKYSKSFESKIVYQSDIENKIFNVLTEEQKVVYKQNQRDFEKRMEDFGKHKDFKRDMFKGEFRDVPPNHPEDRKPPKDERDMIQDLKAE